MLRPWALGLGSWVSKPTAYIGPGLYRFHLHIIKYQQDIQGPISRVSPMANLVGSHKKTHRQVLGGFFYGEKFGGGFMGGVYLSRILLE